MILIIIVISQFCCTSLWFAGNGVMSDLILDFELEESALSHLTSSVQLGFILGTLLFAIFTIADRFSPSRVFMTCAVLGSVANLAIIWEGNNLWSILILRFATGFFLAGIYPVGMKIASDYFSKGLGKSLGFLVGALVLGTAFPHLAKEVTTSFPWMAVIIITSVLALIGGFLILFLVPDGPYRKSGSKLQPDAFLTVFKNGELRAAAFGYFGHMWELYAFWTFTPLILLTYQNLHPSSTFSISLWSFIIIALGGIACVISGYISQYQAPKKIAGLALLLSGCCCVISPFLFMTTYQFVFLVFMIIWGMAVIADSPLLSTIVARSAPPEIRGTALTLVNCIGFSITIISIQVINLLDDLVNPLVLFTILALGPIFGFMALIKKPKSRFS